MPGIGWLNDNGDVNGIAIEFGLRKSYPLSKGCANSYDNESLSSSKAL